MTDSYNPCRVKIILTASAPILTCCKCGKEFSSRGKIDNDAIDGLKPAVCSECEKYISAKLKGGPIGG